MKMDKDPIDDFFKESLQDYKVTPSEFSRNRFLKASAGIGPKGSLLHYGWFKLFLAAAFIGSVVSVYLLLFNGEPSSIQKTTILSENPKSFRNDNKSAISNKTPLSETTPVKAKSSSVPKTTPSEKDKLSVQNGENTSRVNKFPLAESTRVKAEPKEPEIRSFPIKSNTIQARTGEISINENAAEPSIAAASPENRQASSDLIVKQSAEEKSLNPAFEKLPESETQEERGRKEDVLNLSPEGASNAIIKDAVKPEPGFLATGNPQQKEIMHYQPWDFTMNVNFSYERIFSKNDWNKSNTFGLEGKFQKNRISIGAGLELMFTDARNDKQVEYNDYLGSYQKLDSLTFSWDEKHYYLLPTYHMSDKLVWDSAVQLDYFQVTNRYQLLQIPISFGYDFLRYRHFTLGADAGSTVTVFINSRKVSDEYSAGNNRIIRFTPLPSNLTRINWYLLANLSASYEISRNVFIELDPEIRYRVSPVGSSAHGETNKPLYGIRSYLRIKF